MPPPPPPPPPPSFPPPSNPSTTKRKAPNSTTTTTFSSSQPAKKPRFNHTMHNARALLTQPASAAFADGQLDIDRFVRAREFEIKALEKGMRDAKKARSRRAFQEVPRELRRRTAAHDVKRVPGRLRERVAREMVEDNTPTVNGRTKARAVSGRMRLRVERRKELVKMNRNAKAKRKGTNEEKGDEMEVTVTEVRPDMGVDDKIRSRKPRAKTAGLLKNPPAPPSKFRKRQIHKSWLPTHMFHTKRAHMTLPSAPLWRFAMPLSPTQKSYRPIHRASQTRGAVAWDTSYISTIGLQGTEKSVQGLLTAVGVGAGHEDLWGAQKQAIRWRAGTRVWEGWLYERESYPEKPIAPVTILWCAMKPAERAEDINMVDANDTARPVKPAKRKLMIRVHPSAFLQLWEQLLRLARIQRPTVNVEDLRFEIGSVQIAGPNASEALVGVLWPVSPPDSKSPDTESTSPSSSFKRLVSVTSLSALPKNVLLAFTISDPRLHHPPRALQETPLATPNSAIELQRLLFEWPPDAIQTTPAIFSREARLASSRAMSSQKAINRRKTEAPPGQYPAALATDPNIPILLYTSTTGSSATWTLLTPWKAVSPIWNHLMYQPLSTGGVPRFGGLNETRQFAFEAGAPWFPGDYPGTAAGFGWEQVERKRRLEEWDRKPKGKRVAWESLELAEGRKGEIGQGWACDWEFLLASEEERRQIKRQKRDSEMSIEESAQRSQQPQHLPATVARRILHQNSVNQKIDDRPATAVITVRITLLTRGTATPCARIYRLPQGPSRQKWLALLSSSNSQAQKSTRFRTIPNAEKNAVAALASLLLHPQTSAGAKDYPAVPTTEDLIGFVTTGSFNLSEGRSTGIGSVALCKILQDPDHRDDAWCRAVKVPGHGSVQMQQLCIVRNAGESIGRLARWEVV